MRWVAVLNALGLGGGHVCVNNASTLYTLLPGVRSQGPAHGRGRTGRGGFGAAGEGRRRGQDGAGGCFPCLQNGGGAACTGGHRMNLREYNPPKLALRFLSLVATPLHADTLPP